MKLQKNKYVYHISETTLNFGFGELHVTFFHGIRLLPILERPARQGIHGMTRTRSSQKKSGLDFKSDGRVGDRDHVTRGEGGLGDGGAVEFGAVFGVAQVDAERVRGRERREEREKREKSEKREKREKRKKREKREKRKRREAGAEGEEGEERRAREEGEGRRKGGGVSKKEGGRKRGDLHEGHIIFDDKFCMGT
jgi:hypothetical protein